MNTIDKGDQFEQRAYDALAEELRKERLCASPKNAKIFRKKPYYSKDRGSEIITDISIESFLPNRHYPSLIWIFECKDYSGKVPVDDIEEFHAKLQQIGEDNTKGTFVTSGALQRSALSYAQSKRIGVIRLLPLGQIIISLELTMHSVTTKMNWDEFDAALTVPGYRSRNSFFASDGGYWLGSWYSALLHGLSSHNSVEKTDEGEKQ